MPSPKLAAEQRGDSPMSRSPIEFYFDFSSPYGYLAATQIDALAARVDRTTSWKPILLGAVFKVSRQEPLAGIPLKGDYMMHDLPRFARLLNVELKMPPVFPFAAVAPSRAFYWLSDRDAALALRFARACFGAAWRRQLDLAKADVVADLGAELGIVREDLLAALVDPVVKDRLRAEVDAAIAKGVFGSPFFIVDGERFWGADRLGQVETWLQRGGW
jgi:2-hydroxychromene-2-carboxylate isomerase